jgi:hypothetical protein
VIAGLVACIVALALWPGLVLHRAEDSTAASVAAVCLGAAPPPPPGETVQALGEQIGHSLEKCSTFSAAEISKKFAESVGEVQPIK